MPKFLWTLVVYLLVLPSGIGVPQIDDGARQLSFQKNKACQRDIGLWFSTPCAIPMSHEKIKNKTAEEILEMLKKASYPAPDYTMGIYCNMQDYHAVTPYAFVDDDDSRRAL